MFWIILGIVLIVAAFIIAFLIGIDILNGVWATIAVSIGMIGILCLTTHLQEKETAIEALKGNNPFEMKILYEKGDTISYDTIYIKK